MSVQSQLRPGDDVTRVYEAVQENRAANAKLPSLADAVRYADGELAALDWALGRRERSPLTSRATTDVPSPVELDRERRLGTDMQHRQIEMDRRGEYYVSGVEATLMWILCDTDSEPS